MSVPLDLNSLPEALDSGQLLPTYQVFNTMQDDTFIGLVRLTARLFNVPVGIIALVQDEDKMRFGLNHGLPQELDVVKKTHTLCSVALQHDSVTVFNDLHNYPCELIDLALVRHLNLGFYAGRTLRSSVGEVLGVLCIVDYAARDFSHEEVQLLDQLAELVMALLDLRLQLEAADTAGQQWTGVQAQLEASLAQLNALVTPRLPSQPPTVPVLHRMLASVAGLRQQLRQIHSPLQ